ncbi:MAG: adenylate/guanylate cyclase domain-containing protein, partial [Candidatus Kapabacteria bacterium]|nr:adenylate/guanylate cyclase domain-containing protein [Candidatus Kapabacteria bacterium]
YYKNYKIKKKSETLLSEQNEIITIEREKSDKLLLNILPLSIAKRLKNGETFIADKINEATIIFVDIEKFTQLSQGATPDRIVIVLNDIYSKFDQISEKYGIEKIKTIGDCYMAASGVPEQRKDHAIAAANWAIDIGKIISNYVTEDGTKIDFRVGLDAGPVVAGVIGEKKFIYDLWGDTVNTASRMETNGMSGMIHVTDKFKKIIENDKLINNFKFESRGEIDIKGKGKLKTWFMTNNI